MTSVGVMASAVHIAAAGPCTDVLSESFGDLSAWTNTNGTIVAGRTGSAVQLSVAGSMVDYTIPVASRGEYLTLGFAFRITDISDNAIAMFRSSSGAALEIQVQVMADGSIRATQQTSTVLGASSAGAIAINTWYYFELQIRHHATEGSAVGRLNGVTVFSASNVDTMSGSVVIDTLRLLRDTGATLLVDDLYLSTGAGCAFKGDQVIVPPPAAFKTALGSNRNVTSGTTLVITTTAAIAIGDLVVVRAAADNLSATTPTFTCTDSGGNTYTTRAQAAVSATAGNGVAGGVMATKATAAVAAGGTITVTLSGAVTAKAAYAESFTSVSNTLRSTAVTATGTATAATPGASGTVNAGDLVIGAIMPETRAAPIFDSDTLNGAWSTGVSITAADSGTDNTRVEVNGQYKIPNASGAQTYNNTVTAGEWVGMVLVFQATSS